jgi:cellobiose phosphorylase
VEGSRIYHKSEYRERRNHFAVFAVNSPIDGFDTDRSAFCGAYHSFSDPETVFAGESKNSIAHGWQPIGSHHIRLTLAPGETKRYIFALGYCENPPAEKFIAPNVINKAPADRLLEKYVTDAQFDASFAELAAHWDGLLSRFSVKTGDDKLDRM